MERARTEMLRDIGVHQGAAMEDGANAGFAFVIRALSIDYHKPARMDDLLTIETRVEKIGAATLRLGQRVLRGSATLADAKVRVACVAGGRATRIPGWLLQKLRS